MHEHMQAHTHTCWDRFHGVRIKEREGHNQKDTKIEKGRSPAPFEGACSAHEHSGPYHQGSGGIWCKILHSGKILRLFRLKNVKRKWHKTLI